MVASLVPLIGRGGRFPGFIDCRPIPNFPDGA
jgi:hypothetical protein